LDSTISTRTLSGARTKKLFSFSAGREVRGGRVRHFVEQDVRSLGEQRVRDAVELIGTAPKTRE
jgi:hypothetical protein